MKYTKKIPSFFQALLVFILISQIILLPSLAPAQQVTAVETSMLDIEVNVSGAIVTIDQQKKGKAPLRDIELSPGTHHVSVSKKGYLPWTSDLVIEPGEHTIIAVMLIPVDKTDKTKEGQPAENQTSEISPPAAGPDAATGPKGDQEGGFMEKQKVDLGLSTGKPVESSSAFYKTWWFWTLVVLAAGGGAAAAAGGGGGKPPSPPPSTPGTVSVSW